MLKEIGREGRYAGWSDWMLIQRRRRQSSARAFLLSDDLDDERIPTLLQPSPGEALRGQSLLSHFTQNWHGSSPPDSGVFNIMVCIGRHQAMGKEDREGPSSKIARFKEAARSCQWRCSQHNRAALGSQFAQVISERVAKGL